jgi:hypothetical protein
MKRVAVIVIEVEEDEADVATAQVKLIVQPPIEPGDVSMAKDLAQRMLASQRPIRPEGQRWGQA